MNVTDAIRTRCSVRGYTSQPLTGQELSTLLHAGLQAPTATNRQELHFTVLPGGHELLSQLEEEKNRLRQLVHPDKNFYFDAPAVIIISGESAFRWTPVDAGIAVQSIALAAQEMGLGSVILGCIHDALHGEKQAYFEKALGFPEGYSFEIAIAVGHRAVDKPPHTYCFDKQVTRL